jgi:hypothetical protein
MVTISICLSLANRLQAQQTLCQQIGENFLPNFTIGTNEISFTFTSALGVADWNNQKVVINGTLVINSNFQINSCSLKMGKNASIQINPNVSFQTTFSKYFRCGNDLWTGFVVIGGNSVIAFSHVEDAKTGIDLRSSNASVGVGANVFNRNGKGVFAQNIVPNIILVANNFDCTSPVNGNVFPLASAGVELINCPSATIGRVDHPFYRNLFKRQSIGVKLSNSTASIGLSTFNNNSVGVSTQGGNVTIRGANAALPTNFSLNGNDIQAKSTSLEVFLCHLDSCRNNNITSLANNNREQVHIHDNTIHITNEPSPSNSKFGISLDRSKLGNDNLFRNTIDRNHIVIHSFGKNNRRGMHVRGGAATHDYMQIDSNTIEVKAGGSNATHTKFIDIDISGAENFRITRNTIRSENKFSTGNNRWGIFMVNGATSPAEGNILWSNNISGIGPDDGCCAIHAENAGPWSICDNITDHTYRGFHFIGNCGKSMFGSNIIKNHNVDPLNLYVGGTGLFLQGHGADNVFLGDQECQSNFWELTDYPIANAYTAIILGNNLNGPSGSTLAKNEFLVQNLNDPHQAPIDRNPMQNWFKSFQCFQTPTDCVAAIVNEIDEHDEWVKDNYPIPHPTPEVEEWQSTRYVLAKLMRYPELATGDVLDFKNAYNQSSAALFARFDSLMNALSAATSGSQTNLSNIEANIQTIQAQINTLDNSISDLNDLEPSVLTNRAILLSELASLSDQRNAILAVNTSAVASLLSTCTQYNNSLPANQVYEQNQKILNSLAIQQMLGVEFSQTNKNALHAIAQQCIQVAGRTKSAAAGMLPPEEGAQYWHENPDEDNCLERTVQDKISENIGITLSPNPCSEFLQVQFDAPFVGDLIISDLSGQVIRKLQILEKSLILDIPVDQLNNGIYLLSYSDHSGTKLSNAKFVVLR